ncbi:hypothetical protein [Streptomyces sp. NBC_01244]|uniref:hypothetical protein n=1 Tax=Streptomyces sp. NBC_01244 TaxID=2903797 RepID=UPI002E0FA14F|nr:hypothetical protein OG247_32150 [Streptomyces sp. NBC_01244]
MDTQIPEAPAARVLALLDEVDRLRGESRYEDAFWTAQEALEAMPADSSMKLAEFEELQLVAWLKRDHCQDQWTEQLRHHRRPDQPISGPA